jgi:hypothetical protein
VTHAPRLALLLAAATLQAAELRVVHAPTGPLPAAYRVAGIRAEDLSLEPVRASLEARPPLGPAVLAAVDAAEHPARIWVAFLEGPSPPPGLPARLEEVGFPDWGTITAGAPTARWAQVDDVGLFMVRLDQLAAERGAGGAASPAGLVAHELTHVAQAQWGALGAAEGGRRRFHDREDEAEAVLVEALADQAWLRARRRAGFQLTPQERGRLAIGVDSRGLSRCRRQVERSTTYRVLPAGPLHDPDRYAPEADPFAPLRAPPPRR